MGTGLAAAATLMISCVPCVVVPQRRRSIIDAAAGRVRRILCVRRAHVTQAERVAGRAGGAFGRLHQSATSSRPMCPLCGGG